MLETGLSNGPLGEPGHAPHGSSKPGPVPWVIAALALAFLAYLLPKQLGAIQQDVDFGVRSLIATSNAPNVNVDIDGRDVTLHGNVKPKFQRDWFIQSVDALDQVRVVTDDLTEHDPDQEARQLRAEFRNQVQTIDSASISFEPNSADFSAGSEQALEQLVDLLNKNPQRRIKVAGHTDASGRKQINLELSRKRATAVTSYLIDRGVSRQQLFAQGYGSSQPIASNESDEGRARNRRIELIVMN